MKKKILMGIIFFVILIFLGFFIFEKFYRNFIIKTEKKGYIEFELKKEIEFASVNKEDLSLMKEYVFKHSDLKSESIENKNFRKSLNSDICGKQRYNCELFKYNQDIYKVDFDKESERYNFYKNDEIIFSDDMFMITNGPILEFGIIDEKLFFTYNKLDNSEVKKLEDGSIQGHIETYFNGELLTEKYNYSSIKKVFVYKDKIGFLGIKNGKTYIFYNGKEITNGFDRIEVYPCCAVPSLFELYLEKGEIWFLARRDGKNYIVYKNLNFEN
jgi:hypothetical protein